MNNLTPIEGVEGGFLVNAARTECGTPIGYRLGVRTDGSKVLQGAFQWHEGSMHGVTWRTIPDVNLVWGGQDWVEAKP